MTEIPPGWIVKVRPYTREPSLFHKMIDRSARPETMWEFEAHREVPVHFSIGTWVGVGFATREDAISAAVDRIKTPEQKEEEWDVLRGTRLTSPPDAAPKREDGFK